jgi:hypothetical protein
MEDENPEIGVLFPRHPANPQTEVFGAGFCSYFPLQAGFPLAPAISQACLVILNLAELTNSTSSCFTGNGVRQ